MYKSLIPPKASPFPIVQLPLDRNKWTNPENLIAYNKMTFEGSRFLKRLNKTCVFSIVERRYVFISRSLEMDCLHEFEDDGTVPTIWKLENKFGNQFLFNDKFKGVARTLSGTFFCFSRMPHQSVYQKSISTGSDRTLGKTLGLSYVFAKLGGSSSPLPYTFGQPTICSFHPFSVTTRRG